MFARLIGLLFFAAPTCVFAHAFGQQFTLPLPVELYFAGGAAALVASFVILSFLSHSITRKNFVQSITLPPFTHTIPTIAPWVGMFALFFGIIVAFFGTGAYTTNPIIVLFWVGLMLVMTYVCALVMNIWPYIDPFRHSARLLLGTDYPALFPNTLERIGYTIPIFMFGGLIWLEFLSKGLSALPIAVGSYLVIYLFLTLCGVALFGYRSWFMYGDLFSVFFSTVGAFAPCAIVDGKLNLTIPGEHLIHRPVAPLSLLLFILFLLSSTAFDGLHETQIWRTVFSVIFDSAWYRPFMTVMLFLSPFFLFFFYALAIVVAKYLTQQHSIRYLLTRFAYSLIPIAIAYHIAHYFTLVLIEGQRLIAQLSDPFGRGWNLFGTANYQINIAIIDAKTVWYTEISVIIIGHIIATYIAHRIALMEFPSRTLLILSQLPMLVLMVLYTVLGLWILSLPFSIG